MLVSIEQELVQFKCFNGRHVGNVEGTDWIHCIANDCQRYYNLPSFLKSRTGITFISYWKEEQKFKVR
jgi:hypothetical protein